MEKSKILVTGGAGFIGSHLVDYLIKQKHEVIVLDDLSGGLKKNVNKKARFVNGSIINKDLVDNLTKETDIIYHLAAYAAEGLSHFNRRYNYMNNLIGSINLINSAIKNSIKKFLFTSSMAVYGNGNPPFDEKDILNPEDPYGISKQAIEKDLKAAYKMFGLEYAIIRLHNIYGERQFMGDPYRNVIGIWMNRILQNKPLLVYGDGRQIRAFSYIDDVIPCIAKAPFIEEAKNQIINLGTKNPCTLSEIAKKTLKSMKSNLKVIYTEPRFEVKDAYCTIEKSERILGFKDKTSLDEGLRRMAKWAKSNGAMQPIIWEEYELTKNLPDFWKNLSKDFPNASHRINPEKIYKKTKWKL